MRRRLWDIDLQPQTATAPCVYITSDSSVPLNIVCLKDKLRSGSKIRNEADLEWLAHNEVDPAWLEEEDY